MIITTVKTDQELQEILDLQQKNLKNTISEEEGKQQGFVTAEHDFEVLKKMNSPYPHIIAKSGKKVVGYALAMLKEARDSVPVLIPMFEQVDDLKYEGNLLKPVSYTHLTLPTKA